jgi:hypothetical protein
MNQAEAIRKLRAELVKQLDMTNNPDIKIHNEKSWENDNRMYMQTLTSELGMYTVSNIIINMETTEISYHDMLILTQTRQAIINAMMGDE